MQPSRLPCRDTRLRLCQRGLLLDHAHKPRGKELHHYRA